MPPNTGNAIHPQRPMPAHPFIAVKVLFRQWGRLIATWSLLFAISILALILYVVGTPIYFARLFTSTAGCSYECLTPTRILALHSLGLSTSMYATYWIVVNLLFAFIYCTVAIFIFWRKPNDSVAWFASFSLIALGTSFPSIPNTLVVVHPNWWLAVDLLDAIGLPSLIIFLFLFPNGHFVPHWTRWIAEGFAILYVLGTFFPSTILGYANWPRPLHPLVPLTVLGLLVFAQIYRYRRTSTAEERQQTKWVVLGTTIAIIGFMPAFLLSAFISAERLPLLTLVLAITSPYLVLLLIPLSISVAILRYRLWDIDILIRRTLVYVMLTALIIGVYVFVVGYLGALFRTSNNLVISLIATSLVAVLFQPLRETLQRSINRLLYGQRDEPYRVISRLGQRLEATLAPDAILAAIVETAAQSLKLPYAAISLKYGENFAIAASYKAQSIKAPAEEFTNVLHLPLLYQREQVGELLLAPRTRDESFTPADRRLLDDLARQAGIAAHAVSLTADLKRLTLDLQHSRERLVTAREEERRRLRRDLHDGLGPQLASLTLKLETARNRLAHDPLADTLLSDLTDRTQHAVSDIRHLVYALRPPALDELGLVPALREQALQYEEQHLSIIVEAPQTLPPLPAAVEVAVFRIAQEALTNVVRHAQASQCTIRLELEQTTETLVLEVRDNGQGLPPKRDMGVGLHSMRERAEELGGTWTIESLSTGGTRVIAQLPYSRVKQQTDKTDIFSQTTQAGEK